MKLTMKTPHTTRYNKVIKDGTDNLVIRVKPEDIQGAVCRDHQKCVIARAIMRQRASTAKWVDVGASVVLVGTGKNTGRRYFLNQQAREQVRFFDLNDGRAAPCNVGLDAPKRRKLGERTGQPSGSRIRRPGKRQQPTR